MNYVTSAVLLGFSVAMVGCDNNGKDVDFRDQYKEQPSTGTTSGATSAPAEPGAKSDVKNPAAANDPTQTPATHASPQSKKSKH